MQKLKEIVKNLKIPLGLSAVVYAIVLLVVMALTWFGISAIRGKENKYALEMLQTLHSDFNYETGLVEQGAAAVAIGLSNRQEIRDALKQGDRESAQEYLASELNVYRRSINVTSVILVEPGGSVLFRIEQPQSFGDDLYENNLIATALDQKNPLSGVATVLDETGVWSASPVFGNNEFVGLVVVGVNYQEILDTFKTGHNADYQIWLVDSFSADNTQPEASGLIDAGLEPYAATVSAPVPLSDETLNEALVTRLPQTQIIERDSGDEVAVLVALLHAHDNRAIGLVEISLPPDSLGLTTARREILMLIGVACGLTILALTLIRMSINGMLNRPLEHLTSVISRRFEGDTAARVEMVPVGQLGELADVLNANASTSTIAAEEQQELLSEQTARLELVLEVARRLASHSGLESLLEEVVNLVHAKFDLYHTHIYLIDEERAALVMAQGYGDVGAELKRRDHSIPLIASQSLVSQAARRGKAVLVNDTRNDPLWLPNPLLPLTRSELAVPIQVSDEIWGVLDLQSDEEDGISRQLVETIQAIAVQIAVAVRNAGLFAQAHESIAQAEQVQRQYTSHSWQEFSSEQGGAEHEYRHQSLPPLSEITTPEAHIAFGQKQTVNLSTKTHPTDTTQVSTLATPLKLRNQVIGILGVHDPDQNRKWTDDEILLIEAVSEQMTLALENARLFEDAQRNAWRDRVVSETTAKVWASSEIEDVMKEAVAQLGDKLRASEVVIRLGTDFISSPDQD